MKQKFLYIFFLNFINGTKSPSSQEILDYKPPKEIQLQFMKDENIFLKDSLNHWVYRSFYLLLFTNILINTIGLYGVEKDKFYEKNLFASKYVLPIIFTSKLLLNILGPMKLNFFKFKLMWFVGNNIINIGELFYLFNMKSEYKNFYIGNMIIYIIFSNLIMGISSLDNKLKIDVESLIKELETDNQKENLFAI